MAATYTCKVVNNEPICVHTASATTSSLLPAATNVGVDSNIWYNIVLDGDRKNGAIGGTSLNAGGKKGATLLETINSNSDEQKWQFYSIDPRSGDYVLRSKAGTSTSLMGVQYDKTTDETQACMWRANSSTGAGNGVIWNFTPSTKSGTYFFTNGANGTTKRLDIKDSITRMMEVSTDPNERQQFSFVSIVAINDQAYSTLIVSATSG
jgi:hypothetical protein